MKVEHYKCATHLLTRCKNTIIAESLHHVSKTHTLYLTFNIDLVFATSIVLFNLETFLSVNNQHPLAAAADVHYDKNDPQLMLFFFQPPYPYSTILEHTIFSAGMNNIRI